MLNDSVVMLPMPLHVQWDPKRQWRDVTRGYEKINTHRQDGRIVQSHHRILSNNSKCCRSVLLYLSASHAAWLSLPLSEPVSPHQLGLSCLSHGFKISLSLPPLALCAMPIPPSRPLLHVFATFFSSAGCLRSSPLFASFLSFGHPLTAFLSFSHSLLSFRLPQPSVLLLYPCLLISSASSLTQIAWSLPRPPASVTPANLPLPFASLSLLSFSM